MHILCVNTWALLLIFELSHTFWWIKLRYIYLSLNFKTYNMTFGVKNHIVNYCFLQCCAIKPLTLCHIKPKVMLWYLIFGSLLRNKAKQIGPTHQQHDVPSHLRAWLLLWSSCPLSCEVYILSVFIWRQAVLVCVGNICSALPLWLSEISKVHMIF